MKKISVLFFLTLLIFSTPSSAEEWMTPDGRPAQWNDIIKVKLKDIHPTQPALGFDRLFYKLGRYTKDRRKVFDEFCEKNGQKGIKNFGPKSVLQKPETYECEGFVGMERNEVKTVVIGPDNLLYLTDGHHTFNAFWHMPEGGPELEVHVIVARDYRNYPSMDEFWKQMMAEKNIWLYDANDELITPEKMPKSLGMEHAQDDDFRSLMYFTKRIAWLQPDRIEVPDPEFLGDNYPTIPFIEFYWIREIRKTVDLSQLNLFKPGDYAKAIRLVGDAIIDLQVEDVGGSGKPPMEMGQYKAFNEKELFRISRPGTGKLSYMLWYKNKKYGKELKKLGRENRM